MPASTSSFERPGTLSGAGMTVRVWFLS